MDFNNVGWLWIPHCVEFTLVLRCCLSLGGKGGGSSTGCCICMCLQFEYLLIAYSTSIYRSTTITWLTITLCSEWQLLSGYWKWCNCNDSLLLSEDHECYKDAQDRAILSMLFDVINVTCIDLWKIHILTIKWYFFTKNAERCWGICILFARFLDGSGSQVLCTD